MPKLNLSNVRDPGPIPDGVYSCVIEHIDKGATKYGDEMWKLRFSVLDGEYEGRIIHDNLPFSDDALPRVKVFCEAFRLDTTDDLDLTPQEFLGRRCRVTVTTETYKNRSRNKVTFDGYAPDESVS